jgi:hypothetical protein
VAQNRILKLKHPSTHKVPDWLWAHSQTRLMPSK